MDLFDLGRRPAAHLKPGFDRRPSTFKKDASTSMATWTAAGLL